MTHNGGHYAAARLVGAVTLATCWCGGSLGAAGGTEPETTSGRSKDHSSEWLRVKQGSACAPWPPVGALVPSARPMLVPATPPPGHATRPRPGPSEGPETARWRTEGSSSRARNRLIVRAPKLDALAEECENRQVLLGSVAV